MTPPGLESQPSGDAPLAADSGRRPQEPCRSVPESLREKRRRPYARSLNVGCRCDVRCDESSAMERTGLSRSVDELLVHHLFHDAGLRVPDLVCILGDGAVARELA